MIQYFNMNLKKELNEKQYEAVTSNAKYLRIIAGAGSGKTRVLTYRIAYLIEEQSIEPYNLLAITFTNKVAKEMKERTKSLLPNYDLKDLKISTFHSFCNYFLRREIKVLGFPQSFSILDEDDKERLIKDIGADKGYKKSDDIIKQAINYISNKKTLGILPGDVGLTRTSIDANCLEFYKEYEKRKNAQYSLDFDDLLIYTVLILSKFSDIRERYSNRFYEILVDEFQDTNDLQFKLLTLLTGPETGIYVVGDPDQTIYTWRGANQKVILNIQDFYSPLETVILNENYRSTKSILDHANKLISYNQERIKKDLFTNGKEGIEVTVKASFEAESEAKFVVNKIEEIKKRDGANYRDFTILYRSSYSSRTFEKELMTRRIPYAIYSGIKFYERKEVKDALAYFQLILNPLDNVSFSRIINVPKRGIGDVSFTTLKTEANEHNLSMFNYIKEIDNYNSHLSFKVISSLKEMIKLLEITKAKLKDNYEAYSELLNDLLIDLNYMEYLALDDEDNDRISNVKSLIDDIRSYLKENPDSSFDEYLQNIALLTSQDELDSTKDSINLMTVHTAKGLEFEYVFVVNFSEGSFPNGRSVESGKLAQLEEERRLAYVAFTRAKKELYVTYNLGYLYTSNNRGVPSRFIKEADLSDGRTYIYQSQENPRKYAFTTSNSEEKEYLDRKRNTVLFNINQKNSINWKAGDELTHKAFGDGVVLEVQGDILIVDFKNFGIKKMSGSHKFLTKKGG